MKNFNLLRLDDTCDLEECKCVDVKIFRIQSVIMYHHIKKREKRILSNRCFVLSRIAKVQCPEIKRVAIYCRKIENQVLVVGK